LLQAPSAPFSRRRRRSAPTLRDVDAVPDEKRISLRYPGTCSVCTAPLAAKTEAIYVRSARSVRCLECVAPSVEGLTVETAARLRDSPTAGVAGASARREYDRRKASRERRVRAAHPRVGGLMLALQRAPQSIRAWEQGAVGEERLGERLDSLTSARLSPLHDRRIPGTRSNIDHLVVTSETVWVIDTKRYRGRPKLKVEGGLIRPRVERLVVDGRDRTKLIDGALRQAGQVEEIVAGFGVSVNAALCFVQADWPIAGGDFNARGVHIVWPARLAKLLVQEIAGPVDVAAMRGLLARAFPAA
jgi:hypothetical protein